MDSQLRKQKGKMGRKELTSRHQANGPTRPLVSLQESVSSGCSLQQQQQQIVRDTKEQSMDTQCKEIAAMRINSDESQRNRKSKSKRKLLGSKSLSQLVTINFFGKKGHEQKQQQRLSTTKSFPNAAFNFHNEFIPEQAQQEASFQLVSSSRNLSLRQVQSSSMIGMPHQSTRNPLIDFCPNTPASSVTLASTTNISPIPASSEPRNQMVRSVASTPTIRIRGSKMSSTNENDMKSDKMEASDEKEQETAKESKPDKYKSFKNTALVLRDVKNSIGLRMKAKQESKAFAKLTNEATTPPTKLYSPFNIYTPGCSGMEAGNELDNSIELKGKQKKKSKRKLNGKKNRALRRQTAKDANTTSDSIDDSGFNSSSLSFTAGDGDESMTTNYKTASNNNDKTPKYRIALRHKKHLIQTNTFAAFESPAGRLRETVKDVEQFQQCIEDISLAIRARGQLI